MTPHITRLASHRYPLRQTSGYTIDQTILIVAIIAILVTLIIITVGWNLINKASGTKLASQLRQIEDATGQFYAAYRIWPHQGGAAGTTLSAANTLRALAGDTAIAVNPIITGSPSGLRNYIPGFRNNGANVVHNFGTGGTILMTTVTTPYGNRGTYLVVQFTNVPFSEVQQAEWGIDGEANQDYDAGRVAATAAGTNCTVAAPTGVAVNTAASTLVNVCYAANIIQ